MSDNFVLTGKSITDSEPYPYRACGLDGIFLLNGYTVEEHDGEEHVSVRDIDGLHWAIGKHIAMHRKALSPKEVRFLRNTMAMTQAELGETVGKNSQSVARWEKGSNELPAAVEKLLRILFLAQCMDEQELSDFREFLTQKLGQLDAIDETDTKPVQFSLNEHWIEKLVA